MKLQIDRHSSSIKAARLHAEHPFTGGFGGVKRAYNRCQPVNLG